jgi:hypothetical protein
MSCLFTCLLFAIGGAIASGILVDLKWKTASKKILDKLNSLQEGINVKQSEINALNVKLIASNARINMFEVSLAEKDKELNELLKKPATSEVTSVTTQQSLTKKRGPYKKKKNYGRPASNNNSAKKTE